MSSCDEEVHLGDIGTAFRVTLQDCGTPVSLTGVTSINYRFKKSDGTTIDRTGAVYDESGGIVEYKSISGDLDMTGTWKMQVKAVFPTGEWNSEIDEFYVYPNL